MGRRCTKSENTSREVRQTDERNPRICFESTLIFGKFGLHLSPGDRDEEARSTMDGVDLFNCSPCGLRGLFDDEVHIPRLH